MATSGTYFLNGPTLTSSTAVFTDFALSICAPDGFYSDGIIVREQVGCILLPEVVCPSCATPCDTEILGSGNQGIYYIESNTTTDIGAIIIRFLPFVIPDGILVQFGPTLYNGLSSQNYGWLQGSAGLPTYVGTVTDDCGILAGSPYTGVDELEYQAGGFVNKGTTTNVTVIAGQLQLTALSPGICTMVIPKTSNTFTILNSQIIGLCLDTAFSIDISCPVALSSWTGSLTAATGNGACLLTPTQTYYYVHVNGVGGVLGLYDIVFTDPNGENPLAAGYYNTGGMSPSFNWVQVDVNGVVVSFGICEESTNYTVERCYTGDVEVVSISGTVSLGEYVILSEYTGCIWEIIAITVSPATATFVGVTTDTCLDQCSSWQVVNTNGSMTPFDYTDCDGNAITFELGADESVTVCGREITIAPAGVNVTIIDCECDSIIGTWELLGCCSADTIFAIANVAVAPGDLVQVSDTNLVDCWYEVVGLSLSNPTTTIVTNSEGALQCSDVCCQYTVSNFDPFPNEVSFTQCNGLPSITEIPPSTTFVICARTGSITFTGTIDVTLLQCNC